LTFGGTATAIVELRQEIDMPIRPAELTVGGRLIAKVFL
jgi:hypothetical protein